MEAIRRKLTGLTGLKQDLQDYKLFIFIYLFCKY